MIQVINFLILNIRLPAPLMTCRYTATTTMTSQRRTEQTMDCRCILNFRRNNHYRALIARRNKSQLHAVEINRYIYLRTRIGRRHERPRPSKKRSAAVRASNGASVSRSFAARLSLTQQGVDRCCCIFLFVAAADGECKPVVGCSGCLPG